MGLAKYVGHIDAIQNNEIYGWALNVSDPTKPVIVSLYVNDELAAESLAGYYRPDVAKALSCTGRNGFYVDLGPLWTGSDAASIDIQFPNGAAIDGGPLVHQSSLDDIAARRPTLLFMHIPKTAGTAFREVVMPNYRQSEVAYIYGDPPGFPSTNLRDLPLAQRASFKLVFGHFGFGTHADIPNHCDYATLIRDPLLRTWSHYMHLAREKDPAAIEGGKPKQIEDMLEHKDSIHLDNLYVRYFCGHEESLLPPGSITRDLYELALANALKPNVFIGHQNDLAAAYQSLVEELGWIPGLECPRVNLSPRPELLPNRQQEMAIRHFNEWDFKLYEEINSSRIR